MADKRCALDVNVLLDLAEQKNFALAFLDVIREKYCPLFVCPTAFIELQFLAESGRPLPRKFAGIAIDSFLKWGVFLFDIEPVKHGYAKIFADRLIRKGFLSEDEYNDGLILGEAACFEIPILVTSDHHLLDISRPHLIAELKASDFFPTAIFSPQKLFQPQLAIINRTTMLPERSVAAPWRKVKKS
jgi:hypothetical protein